MYVAPTPDLSWLPPMMLDGLAVKLKLPRSSSGRPGGKRDYRRSARAPAWELAWHIANTDVQFRTDRGPEVHHGESAEADNPRRWPSWWIGNDKNMKRGRWIRALRRNSWRHRLFMAAFRLPAVLLAFLNISQYSSSGRVATYLVRWGRRCLRFMEEVTTSRFSGGVKGSWPSRRDSVENALRRRTELLTV